MAETDLSGKSTTVNAGVGLQPRLAVERKTDTSTVEPGAIVQSKSVSDSDILLGAGNLANWDAAVNRPYGCVNERGELDLDAAFAASIAGRVSPLGSRDIVYVEVIVGSGDLIEGDKLYLHTTGGQAAKMTIAVAGTPTADEVLAHHRNYIGMVIEFSANDASDTRWVKTFLN